MNAASKSITSSMAPGEAQTSHFLSHTQTQAVQQDPVTYEYPHALSLCGDTLIHHAPNAILLCWCRKSANSCHCCLPHIPAFCAKWVSDQNILNAVTILSLVLKPMLYVFGQKGLTHAVHHDKMGLGAVNQSVGKVKPELQMPRIGLEQQMNMRHTVSTCLLQRNKPY